MTQDFLQFFLTKKPNYLKKKHPKLPRNNFLISGQNFFRMISPKKNKLFGKYFQVHPAHVFFKVRLMRSFEDKHLQKIQDIEEIEKKLSVQRK